MDPEESSAVIRQHVTNGLDLARKARLPARVQAFIPEHHGTRLVTYFYRTAAEHNPNVDAAKFQYPGPRPQSRETAIVMLADGTEAMIRSSADRSPDRIDQLVDEVIAERMAEGQLDDSDLTLRDLRTIASSFKSTMRAVYHPRVAYPEPTPMERRRRMLRLPLGVSTRPASATASRRRRRKFERRRHEEGRCSGPPLMLHRSPCLLMFERPRSSPAPRMSSFALHSQRRLALHADLDVAGVACAARPAARRQRVERKPAFPMNRRTISCVSSSSLIVTSRTSVTVLYRRISPLRSMNEIALDLSGSFPGTPFLLSRDHWSMSLIVQKPVGGSADFIITAIASTVISSPSPATAFAVSRWSDSPAAATRSPLIVPGTPLMITRFSNRFLIHVMTRM